LSMVLFGIDLSWRPSKLTVFNTPAIDGKIKHKLTGHVNSSGSKIDAILTPDGRFVISGAFLSPPKPPYSSHCPLHTHSHPPIYMCPFSPPFWFLIRTGSQDGKVFMWNASTGAPSAVIEGEKSPSSCVRFNPAFMMMVTAHNNLVSNLLCLHFLFR